MMANGRIGADMRSAEDSIVLRQIQEVLSRKAAEQIGKESTRRQEGRSAEGA